MKRFITVLSGLLVLPAFAEVAPLYYDEIVEYTDEMLDAEDAMYNDEQVEEKVQPNVSQRTTFNRSTSASRAMASGTNTSGRNVASSRAITSSPRTSTGSARGTASRTAKTNTVVSRLPVTSRATVTSRGAKTNKATTARVGTSNNSVMPGNKYSTYGTNTVLTDSGNSLYNPNTSRIGVGNRRATARISTPIVSTTSNTVITEEDVSTTTNNLTALAELTDYCKAQYAACMDNYCNVLDDNQGRCSCSKNIKTYAKTEEALAKATEDFQAAVQKIKYIGLTSNQIESLFEETEAEIAMKKTSDSSRLKGSLDAVKKSVKDVSSPNSSTNSLTDGFSLDSLGLMNFDSISDFNFTSFLNNNNNTNSVSNQRGEQLYKTAANRCRTNVLNSCTAQGIDANVITNSYDLEIDKQCMAYERSLNEANTEMRNNVTNATYILQQARLLLAQNKNSYDLRGCVAAIDSCMQDEYVCGTDYELCLDPTNKYLANGAIVVGGTPGVSGGQNKNTEILSTENMKNWTSGGMYNLYSTWNYDIKFSSGKIDTSNAEMNAWSVSTKENLGDYIDNALSVWKSNYNSFKDTTKTENMAIYLLQKVGYIDSDDKVHGMCASVMKQCQDYTFSNPTSNNKKYLPSNEVVRQYLNTALAKIKVKQDTILADYAEDCRSEVQSCLSTNGYDESNTSSTISKTAVNACASEITTCMSVGGYQVSDGVKLTLRAMTDWVASMLITCPTNTYLYDNGVGTYDITKKNDNNAVACKSCPRYWVLNPSTLNVLTNSENKACKTKELSTSAGGQVTNCDCPEGFTDGKWFNPSTNETEHACIASSEEADDTMLCSFDKPEAEETEEESGD